MGQITSNMMKKVWSGSQSAQDGVDSQVGSSTQVGSAACLSKFGVRPFIYHRQSSLFIDEDGDVAHEFYIQKRITSKVRNNRKKRSKLVMEKIPNTELTPLGTEALDHPALSVDFPIIICEAPPTR